MLLLAVVAALSVFLVQIMEISDQARTLSARLIELDRAAAIAELSVGATRFEQLTLRYPDSLDELTQANGFEYLAASLHPLIEYRLATSITDSQVQFQRAALVYRRPGAPEDPATYFDAERNTCSGEPFASAMGWCGDLNGIWWRDETRVSAARRINDVRANLNRTLQMLAIHFNRNGRFPDSGAPPGESVPLAQVLGAGTQASTCSGLFTVGGAVFGCEDAFAPHNGEPTVYTRLADDRILLTAVTSVVSASGQRIAVTQELGL
jgi:hypothetical protein